MITAAVVITLLYVFTMLFLLYGFFRVPHFSGKDSAPKNTFSIIIALRNEAENLPALFDSLLQLKYPPENFEILLINDASTDASEALCQDFRLKHPELNIRVLQNLRKSGSPKKDAIDMAIKHSTKEFILTTDADCMVPKSWLQELSSIIEEEGADVVAGPVRLKNETGKNRFLRRFQEMDIFSLQAATIGGFGVGKPFMCNGANFCYSRKAFLAVDGFKGNESIASGDDVFLLEKFHRTELQTSFLRSKKAIVVTSPVLGLKEMFSQRIRWAGKTSATGNAFGKGIGIVVFLMNLSLCTAFTAWLTGIFPLTILMGMFLFKFNVDFLLIYRAADFFDRESSLKSYFLSSLFYPFFSSSVAVLSLFSGYEWKGRRFKK